MENNFSENLKKLRIDNNYTQTSLADKLGISRTSLSYYENGVSEPDLHNLILIAKFFNISIDDLVAKTSISSTIPPIYTTNFDLDKFTRNKLLNKLENNKKYYESYLKKINKEIPEKIEEINKIINLINSIESKE